MWLGDLRMRRWSELSYDTSSVHHGGVERRGWPGHAEGSHLSNRVLRTKKMTGDTRRQASTADGSHILGRR